MADGGVDMGMTLAMVTAFRGSDGKARGRKELLQTMLLLLLPWLLRQLKEIGMDTLVPQLFARLQRLLSNRWHVREIEYVTGGNTRLDIHESAASMVENTDRNNLLQKAIRLFVANKYKLDAEEMETNLVPTSQLKLDKGTNRFGGEADSMFSGSYKQLKAFSVHMLPKKGDWTLIDEARGIWFMQNKETYNAAGKNAQAQNGPVQMQTKTTFSIRARGAGAAKVVEEWIKEAFDWYREVKHQEQDDARYFLTALPLESGDDKNKQRLFKRHALADVKTFKSLWFPEKDSLLQLLEDFQQKQGKFAVEGFPHKIGLLLHGPPGTGKTSLIKAIAHHTGRHVVAVNLAQIKTNRDLEDLMFDLNFPIKGGELPLKLAFKDVVFVMEDIDAASKVVFARKGSKAMRRKRGALAGKAVVAASSSSSTSAGTESPQRAQESPEELDIVLDNGLEQGEMSQSEEEADQKESKSLGVLMSSVVSCLRDKGDGEGPIGCAGFYKADDELNLAGLLNVLDGVVDTPGRIVVMTTNHPEKLDPALVRPGRINKRLHLGFVEATAMQSMVEHYLQLALSPEDKSRLSKLTEVLQFTPAEVEQCCAEASDVDSFLRAMEATAKGR